MKEYLERVYASILANTELQNLGEGIPELLVQQAQAVVLMHRAVENVQRKLAKTKEVLKQRLECTYPVRSRIGPWLRDRLRTAEERFIEECKWSAHEEALALCTNQHLNQTVYFLHRDLTFMKEREPVLKKELRHDKTPTRVFQWRTHIWLPSNWVVRRSFQGHSEVIPTVLSSTATSITTPRSDPSQPVFLVEKEIVRTTTTRWPLWRWINYCHRTWSWTWNAMFFFGVVIPWCSPVSIRALLCINPFTPDLELSQVNGTLFPRQSSSTPTMLSTLRTLARHISKATTQFESKPDTGFIGKGMTRQLNKAWNYIGKGVFGTLGLLLFFPPLCLLTSALCLAIAATAFLWMPVVTLLLHIAMGLFWDLDSPMAERNKYLVILEAAVWDILIQGLLQPIAAIVVTLIICPLLSFLIVTFALLRYCMRLAWDALVFHALIKKRGRIPASDSVIVKRIAGPGLNSNYFYQIRPEQALAAFEAKLELDELSAFQHQMEHKIMQPQKDFSQFVNACFGPFSASLARVGAYKSLEREAQDLLTSLHEKLDKRRRELQTGLATGLRARLKLNIIDLKISIQQGALMLERFYPSHVLWRLGMSEQEFWDSKALTPNDWPGLAALLYADVFSLDFLTPLDESDICFRLEASPQVDLSRYCELVRGAGGLDLLGPVYAPRANIQVHSPYLDVTAFNPRHKPSHTNKSRDLNTGVQTLVGDRSTFWRPWKRPEHSYSAEKLAIPLPIPHPVQIAVIIYNRDTDTPIPVDSDLCRHILRVFQFLNYRALEEGSEEVAVARYRGGGEGESAQSSSCCSSASEHCKFCRYLKEFRVEQCSLFLQHKCTQHRPFTCFHWHFMNQRRRRPVRKRDGSFNYSADNYCSKYDETTGICPDGDECPFLHRTAGDTERRYHLRYYKTCMCVHDTDARGFCVKNGPHCAFAHGGPDLRPPVYDIKEIQALENPDGENGSSNGPNVLDKERNLMNEDPKWQDTNYVLSSYKTEQCKRPPRLCRQGYACPQYHNSRDKRRSPRKFKYRSTPCPNVKHGDEWGEPSNCENGDICSYCHTRTEQQFHPEIYKSTKCNDVQTAGYCPRGVFCAFAHVDQEMSIARELAAPLELGTNLGELLSNALPSNKMEERSSESSNGSGDVSESASTSSVGSNSSHSKAPGAQLSHTRMENHNCSIFNRTSRHEAIHRELLREQLMVIENDPLLGDSEKAQQKHNLYLAIGISSQHHHNNSSLLPLSSLHYDIDSVVGSSAPVNIPGSTHNSCLSSFSPTRASPLHHLQSGFLSASRFSHQDPLESSLLNHVGSNHVGSSSSKLGSLTNSGLYDYGMSPSSRNPLANSPLVGGFPVSPSLSNSTISEVARLREEVAGNRSKLVSCEEQVSQARGACEAWQREAEEANRKATIAEQQRDEAMNQAKALQKEVDLLQGSPYLHGLRRVSELKTLPLTTLKSIQAQLRSDLEHVDKVRHKTVV
ncbi:hypothetical protein AAG570_005511 [Ranatra chinensis]|uniref:C3H1-type domain-containing protein n=1 Tax=Ranatra chinensis TaxID=642074 RepID=A0ABD0XXN0_9HEMI